MRINIMLIAELSSGPPTITKVIPMIPKASEAQMNIFVAMFFI